MSLPTIEIAELVASDAYKKEPSVINPLFEIILSQPGAIAAWHGLEVQDPQHLYIVVAWKTLEHHQALASNAAVYSTLRERTLRAATETVVIHHAHFDGPIDAALGAPITEFVVFALKPGADRDAYYRRGAALAQTVYSRLAGTVVPGGWGPVVEDERKFQVCNGWPSLERFSEVPKNAELWALIEQLREKADADMKLVRFTKFTKN